MTEKSYLWTTGGAGDGSATYTRADWSIINKILACSKNFEGVAPGYLNVLAGTVTGANAVSIASGGGIVDGRPYGSDAAVSVTIPSAVGGGNTRIDRIVLRADWTAQTVRITRIAGTDAASPTAPAIVTNSGTTYDIKLYQALVNTTGTVTLTDERPFATVGTTSLTDASITTAKIADANVTVAKMAANSVGTSNIIDANVTAAKHAANSVQTAHIVDANVTTAKIADANVTGPKVANNSIATAHLQNSAVTFAKIAAYSVDDSRLGDRAPFLDVRQNGGAGWNGADDGTGGSGAISRVRIQIGVLHIAGTSGTLTFPTAYSDTPFFIVSNQKTQCKVQGKAISNAQATITSEVAGNDVAWIAIGPT